MDGQAGRRRTLQFDFCSLLFRGAEGGVGAGQAVYIIVTPAGEREERQKALNRPVIQVT